MTIMNMPSITKNELGIGVEWDPSDNYELTHEEWDITYERLDFMRVRFIRCMYNADYYCKGFDQDNNPIYDWQSRQMKNIENILTYCEEKNVSVIVGEWSKPKSLGITSSCDPRWIRMIVDFLEHMLPKYTCIKIYNFINEPDGEWGIDDNEDPYEIWKKGITCLSNALKKRHLRDRILLTGPDVWYHIDWIDKIIEDIPETIDIYNVHHYASDNSIINGEIEKFVKKKRELIHHQDTPSKAFYMGEAGLVTGKDAYYDQQHRVKNFDYGVYMADYIIQSMRGGQTGIIMWMLDDIMHNAPNTCPEDNMFKVWGFWSSFSKEETPLRPWYYPVALLSRYFPAGCQIHHMTMGGIGVRAVCGIVEKGDCMDYTLAFVTHEKEEQVLDVALPHTNKTTLSHYHYFESSRPTDEQGFPVPVAVLKDVKDKVTIQLPSNGMVLLTTMT
ncbi:hypothetical protein HZI73_04795 [Vallitalea pronyensis]|uniref:Glycoside hydrolase family 5 domain-containing protein n=1 Tax=Vallitalea pronyensis TaxID=1348613 RepID=A0A8J8MHJ5_9FIRM|nr:hypothetical protein [Vallitalea pronyensis]QUI21651.1 hypothetical protein HZI73_04795 [Vallitalea pronyensis]